MNTFTLITTGLLSATYAASGSWLKVQDFEGDNSSLHFYWQTQVVSGVTLPGQYNAPYQDFLNPDNTVVAMSPGFDGLEFNNLSLPMAFSRAIPQGNVGSIYFRVAIFGYDLNVCFGCSYEALRIEADGMPWPRVWNEFSTYSCITNQTEPKEQILIHDGYSTPGNRKIPNTFISPGNWYEFWVIIDNQSKTAQWYIQGPDDSAPKLARVPIYESNVDTGNLRDFAYFRNNQRGENDIRSFFIVATNLRNRHQGDFFLFDDLYVDPTGANLTNPLAGDPCAIFSAEGWYVYNHVFGISNETGHIYYTEFCPFVWDYSNEAWLYFFTPAESSSFVYNFRTEKFYFAWMGHLYSL